MNINWKISVRNFMENSVPEGLTGEAFVVFMVIDDSSDNFSVYLAISNAIDSLCDITNTISPPSNVYLIGYLKKKYPKISEK